MVVGVYMKLLGKTHQTGLVSTTTKPPPQVHAPQRIDSLVHSSSAAHAAQKLGMTHAMPIFIGAPHLHLQSSPIYQNPLGGASSHVPAPHTPHMTQHSTTTTAITSTSHKTPPPKHMKVALLHINTPPLLHMKPPLPKHNTQLWYPLKLCSTKCNTNTNPHQQQEQQQQCRGCM